MSTQRLETLADGVFAIVMTLLVFELRVPEAGATLPEALLALAPSFLSYVVSFVLLGVYWVGHHSQFQHIRRADRTLLWLNILFLLCVALVPFSAGMLGRHGEEQIAVILYGVHLIAVSLAHYAMWQYATDGHRLVEADLEPGVVGMGTRLSLTPPILYLAAIGLSFLHTALSVAIYVLVPLLFASGLLYRWWSGRDGPA